jgi:hypothetical protein
MRSSIIVTFGLAAGVAAAAAQTKGATIAGEVRSADGRPLDGASVDILGSAFRITTADHGTFRFAGVPAGRYWILVRRIGFTPLRISATLGDGDNRFLPLSLAGLPQHLSEIRVMAEDGMSRERYQDFFRRAHTSFGKFLTRDDLAALPGDLVAIAQRFMPGKSRLALEQHFGAAGDLSAGFAERLGGIYGGDDGSSLPFAGRALATFANANCTPGVSVNGDAPIPGLSVSDFDRERVEALEIYRRGSVVPTEFAYRNTTGCGLIVVWLRRAGG